MRSPGGPRKDWDCVWPPPCVGPRVYVDAVNHSLCRGTGCSSFHCLRGFFWRLLCKTGYGSYQFFSEVLFENSDGKLFNMFTFLCIYSLYKMFGRKDQYLETTFLKNAFIFILLCNLLIRIFGMFVVYPYITRVDSTILRWLF